VGIGATVLPLARVGARTILGAGSVVTRDLPVSKQTYNKQGEVSACNE
jgi:acetyltransferase-like isoleucine patch superfamily enzyme